MMSFGRRIVVLYAFFAAIAICVNLTSQWLTLTGTAMLGFARGLSLFPALIVGTGVGLIVKYVLDKRYIFGDCSCGISAHAKDFSLYTMTGVFTTAIFWATELFFAKFGPSGKWIYIGGAVGLAIGYTTKYYLDRRYVFTSITVAESKL